MFFLLASWCFHRIGNSALGSCADPRVSYSASLIPLSWAALNDSGSAESNISLGSRVLGKGWDFLGKGWDFQLGQGGIVLLWLPWGGLSSSPGEVLGSTVKKKIF